MMINQRVEELKKILETFNQEKINYCILRNYEFLYDFSYPFESLDTIVSKTDFRRLEKVLHNFGFNKRKQQFSLTHQAYYKFIDGKPISFDLQVGGIHWNDMVYLNEKILINKIRKRFFYIPSDNDTFVMLLVHSILGKRYFKPKYQQILFSLYLQVNRSYVALQLSRIFNRQITKNLLSSVKNNHFNQIKTLPLVFYFIFSKFTHPFTFTALTWRWFKQRKNPFRLAPLISLIGPDGAGKSTAVNGLIEHLQKSSRKVSLIYTGRGRNHILPITILGKKYKKKETETFGDKEEQLKRKPSLKTKVTYTLAAPIFTLDLLLRYWLRIFPQRLKKKIVITDRYCSDIILMKNVSFAFKRFLLSLFPKPTISVLLYNSPEILHQRRPAESIIELERQMAIFRRFRYSLALKTNHKEKDTIRVIEFVLGRLYYRWW